MNNNLWLVSKNGEKFYQLTHIRAREASLHAHFSHDGTKLFWAARLRNRKGVRRYRWVLKLADFIVDEDGPRLANEQTLEPLIQERFEFYEGHGFTLGDRAIIYSASKSDRNFDLDIYVTNLATGKTKYLTNSPREWDEHAILSPGGGKMVWISSYGYNFNPSEKWGQSLKTEYWLMNQDGSDKQQVTFFNVPGYPEYTGDRIIAADSSWNARGDELVATLRAKRSRIVLIKFKNSVDAL